MTTVRETREREKVGREAFGKFFYDLAKLTFGGMVIGGMMSMKYNESASLTLTLIFLGLVSTVALAKFAKNVLK